MIVVEMIAGGAAGGGLLWVWFAVDDWRHRRSLSRRFDRIVDEVIDDE